MRGYIDGNLRGQHQAEVEFLSRALDILEWGRERWADVPRSDRGSIFEITFIRGVRNMHLHAMMEVLSRIFSAQQRPDETLGTFHESLARPGRPFKTC